MKASMTRKCHNHTLQTNPKHHEGEHSALTTTNRSCLGQFREIPWNQTTDVHRGSTLITG